MQYMQRKNLKKVRKSLMFVHDIEVLKSSYDLNLKDKRILTEIKKELEKLETLKSQIQDAELVAKIDDGIKTLSGILALP